MQAPGKRASDTKLISLLGAFCIFLSMVEYMIPKPLPFLRLGLANLPLMLALDIFNPLSFLLLILIKILGQALISGTLFSYIFLFSLAGSSTSALAMYLIRRLLSKKRISYIGIGTIGALLSNLVQLGLARFLLFGSAALYLAPPFLAMGIISGILFGIFCERFTAQSLWYKRYCVV